MPVSDTEPPSPPEDAFPYGARVDVLLGNNVDPDFPEIERRAALDGATVLRVITQQPNAREQANNHKRLSFRVEGFRSASEAEQAGIRLVRGVLWAATSQKFALAFERWVGSSPFAVYDRTRGPGIELRGEARVYQRLPFDALADLVRQGYKLPEVAPAVSISLELFAASRFEVTERARFITLVTALEALASQDDYSSDALEALKRAAAALRSDPAFLDPTKHQLRESLSGRILELRRESVRQAIIRLIGKHFADRGVRDFVERAYATRSDMLHEGLRVEGLHDLANQFEDVLRELYASMFGLPLARAVVR